MVKVGDLVYVVSNKQVQPLPNQLKGVIFSQIDKDWFRVYIAWDQHSRIQEFPSWMLEKVQESS
jgi:hypothetical protein|tara:strand:+ start:487 stop:678 length:192 start_codon:yes stop_codon:yes gene_type:complete